MLQVEGEYGRRGALRHLANSKGGILEESESGELKPLSKRQRYEADVIRKVKSMRDDPNSRPFSFSRGYILFRSRLTTVVVQGVLLALVAGIILGVGDSLTGIKHSSWIHILNFRVSRTNLWLIIMTTALFVTDTAFLLRGTYGRERRVIVPIVLVLILVAPTSLFHWGK